MASATPGFKLSWHVENGILPDVREFVSKALSGEVSTPQLGSPSPPDFHQERHEYAAVIEMPYDITDVIGGGALVVDVTVSESSAAVELVTA